MTLFLTIGSAAMVVALSHAPTALAGYPTASYTIELVDRHPKVTWTLAGAEPDWYVEEIEIADDPQTASNYHFFVENLVDYEFFYPSESTGYWLSEFQLDPGTYWIRLFGTKPGCPECWFASSAKRFTVTPAWPGVTWSVSALGGGRVRVRWTNPSDWWATGVYVSPSADFADTVASSTWPADFGQEQWDSRALAAGTYYVKLRFRHEACGSSTTSACIRDSDVRTVTVASNSAPRITSASFTIARTDPVSARPTWRIRFTACDDGRTQLTAVVEEDRQGRPEVASRFVRKRLGWVDGCRKFTITRRSAIQWRYDTTYYVGLQITDGDGWSRVRAKRWHVLD